MTKLPMLAAALLAALTLATTSAHAATGAERHTAKGIACEACHGPDKANPKEPTLETCTGCHNLKQLVEKTKDKKPHNPHTSPHYQDTLDCINCHVMHGDTVNFCDQCHSFGFKVP